MIDVYHVDYLISDPPAIDVGEVDAIHMQPKQTEHLIAQVNWEDPENHNNFLNGSFVVEVPKGASSETIRKKVLEKIIMIGKDK